jgi:Alpha galactosidase A/Alpha galactosidase C-terminal beta sandwich domain
VLQYGVRRHRQFAVPANVLALCAACVGACLGPCALAASAAGAAVPLSWSGALEVDRGTALSGVSCPSIGLCVAVDGAGRALVGTNPSAPPPVGGAGAWSEPFAIGGAGALTSISCAAASECVAVDAAGRVAVSTHPTTAGSGMWSEARAIGGAEGLTSVSCPSTVECVAVDGKGHVSVSTDPAASAVAGAWSEARAIAGAGALASVSCASMTLCAAVDGEGHVSVSTDPAGGAGTWHTRLIDPSLGLVAISCFSGGCVAVDSAGNALASSNAAAPIAPGAAPGSGATWSATGVDVFGAPSALACMSTAVCVAVDGGGYAFTSQNPTAAPPLWSATGLDTQSAGALKSVSCIAEGLCAAVDAGGRVFTAAFPAPAPPSPPPSEVGLVTPHPSIAGAPAPGQRLTCRPGVSAGVSASDVALTYAWLRDTRAIAGASGSTYGVGGEDVSHHLQCRVTATTAAGSVSANSAFVTVPAGGLGTISETAVGAPRAGRFAVGVPLICSAQAAGSCTLKLRLTVQETLRSNRIVALAAAQGTRRVSVTVGARTVRLRPAQRYTAIVALNATGRRLLAGARRLAVRLTVSGTIVGVLSASLKSATVIFGAPARKSSHTTHPRRSFQPPSARRASAGARATTAAVLTPTPYMGWDSYFAFGGYFDEGSVLAQASQLLTRGLAGLGYHYVWLDVGWWQGTRDAAGNPTTNPAQWPHGIAWLARTLHAAGLRLGLYTDAGRVGCGGANEGSYGHYQQDVNTFAAWGVDAVKVDFCGGVRLGLQPTAAYASFHEAIVHNSSRRPMLLSICDFLQPGQFAPEDPAIENSAFTSYTFGPSSGNSWRTNTDVGTPGDVPYTSVLRNLDADAAQPQAAGPGHWNDPDYLGPDQGMNAAQFRTQMSMWAMLAAPLMVSANLISLTHTSAASISNRQVIAIDQDPAGQQARLLAGSGEAQVWVKPLSDGSRAVALLNRGAGTLRIATTPSAMGMPRASGYALRNAWTGTLTTTGSSGTIAANVPSDSTVLLRVSPK